MNIISKSLIFLSALFFFVQSSNAQRMTKVAEKKYKMAIQYAEESNNVKAISILQDLYKSYPDNINVTYNLGLCYMNMSGNPDSALYFLNKTLKLDGEEWTEDKLELMIAIAHVKQLKYDYDGALKTYNQIERHDKNQTWKELIEHERFVCDNAKIMMNNPVRLQVQRLGNNINSEDNDYRPLISDDMKTLIFTSRRKNKVRTQFQDGQNEECTYISTRPTLADDWGEAEEILNIFEDKGQTTATCLRDSDLYLVRDGDIYVSKLDTNGVWQRATKLEAPINSSAEERFAYVTADGNELFFSSDRKGGLGGFDIYHSFRLPNGKWGVPTNMGDVINTPNDEDAPVKHPTKNVLYFSSNGHNTMGGFDIFYTIESQTDSTYEAVQNIGYPINTPDDDLFFVPTSVKDMGYYASVKWDNTDDVFTGYDIYEVEYDEPEINRLVILSGLVKSNDIGSINITADSDGEPLGRYLPNGETGKFVIVGEEGRTYHISATNGKETNSIDITTEVGDSYYKTGKTIEIKAFEFAYEEEEPEVQTQTENSSTGYTIQIFSLRKPLDKANVRGIDTDKIHEHVYADGWYVYSYGQFNTPHEAKPTKDMIVEKTPYTDSFIRNNEQYKKFEKKAEDQ